MPLGNEILSPRESYLIDNENQQMREARNHAVLLKKLEIEEKKIEFKLKQADAVRSRIHQQKMKELELAIRDKELKWGNLLRLPTLLLKLPVLILLGIAYIIAVATKQDINNTEFWRYLR